MFTGLVAAVGRVERHAIRGDGSRLRVAAPLGELALGESIAVSGACLTVAACTAASFEADLSSETLARTTLGRLGEAATVNLERAARLGDRLGGHLVTGHVDGLARVLRVEAAGDSRHVELEVPPDLARFIAEKGSVALDGVSLTVNRVGGARFEIMLIPHTLAATTLGLLERGQDLNLEVDLVARYVERLVEAGAERREASAVTLRGAV
jgi:riboflavin synthase